MLYNGKDLTLTPEQKKAIVAEIVALRQVLAERNDPAYHIARHTDRDPDLIKYLVKGLPLKAIAQNKRAVQPLDISEMTALRRELRDHTRFAFYEARLPLTRALVPEFPELIHADVHGMVDAFLEAMRIIDTTGDTEEADDVLMKTYQHYYPDQVKQAYAKEVKDRKSARSGTTRDKGPGN